MRDGLAEIRRKRFNRERVVLDGYAFFECTFIDCTIAFSGGDCLIEETMFVRPRLEMSGAAASTAEILHALGALNEKMFRFPK
jgi:hypothetical protein